MTVAKKIKTAAKKNNDSSNYQTNGGNIGPNLTLGPTPPGSPLGPPSLVPSLGPPAPSLGLPGPFPGSLVPWAMGP